MRIPAGQDVRDYLFTVESVKLTGRGNLLQANKPDPMRVALPLIGPSAMAVWQMVLLAASESPDPVKGLSLAPMVGLSAKSKAFSSTVHRLDRFGLVAACIGDVVVLSPYVPLSFVFRRVREGEDRPPEFHVIRERLVEQLAALGNQDMRVTFP
jgi:hypothetical protein